jgi:ABC-type multidrug transport system ATPase subunit
MTEGLAISARGLTKRYKQVVAVDNLDLDIPFGTVYGFLGPNGAGKTTTIRMLLGLVRPTAGSAQVLGHSIDTERSMIAPKVGAIVESPAFYPYLTGAQNLEVLWRSSDCAADPARIAELLDRVGLAERGKHKVKTYSLGMKQRLGIAATLLTDPEIIFLDEPTNGLDPAGTVEVRNLIRQLGQDGHTIFLSSHLLSEVEQVCSDVAIVQQGKLRLQGRVRDLLGQTTAFVIEATPADRALELLCAQPELDAHAREDGGIEVVAEAGQVSSLVRSLVEAGVDISGVRPRQTTLEQLFLELTGQPRPDALAPHREVAA